MTRRLAILIVVLAVGFSAAGIYAAANRHNSVMSGACPMYGGQSASCCPYSQAAAQKTTTKSAVCPVMGNKIPDVTKAAGKSVYKGKTYYFCCAGCKPKFDKDPAKYVK